MSLDASNYVQLTSQYERLSAIDHALDLLNWDDAVMLSPGGGEDRANAMATLMALSHEFITSAELGELIEAVRDEGLNEWQAANLREISSARRKALAIPADLVVAAQIAGAKCLQLWRTNRPLNDWKSTESALAEVVNLTQQRAQCLGDALGLDPYDALMNQYQDGLTQQKIDPLFDRVSEALPNLIEQIVQNQPEVVPFTDDISDAAQMELAKELMRQLGFDFERGRIDTSHHPFSSGFVNDTRMTTRFTADDFTESIYATIHETGHSLYTQGLPKDWKSQAVGGACGMALHESQSLFMEMQLCRTAEFVSFSYPIVRDRLGGAEGTLPWTFENYLATIQRVQRSLIRVQADEATYPLHIILRYELEKKIIADDLRVADLPAAWNQSMQRYFGLSTADDFRDGCMQDIHWYDGTFGYFPCYSLGAFAAAQFFNAYVHDCGSPGDDIASGNFEPIVRWLRTNIHSQGRRFAGLDLIERVCNEPLGTDAFLRHVTARYAEA